MRKRSIAEISNAVVALMAIAKEVMGERIIKTMHKINRGPHLILVEELVEAETVVVMKIQKMSNAILVTNLNTMPWVADINSWITMSNPTLQKHQIKWKIMHFLLKNRHMINMMCGILILELAITCVERRNSS